MDLTELLFFGFTSYQKMDEYKFTYLQLALLKADVDFPHKNPYEGRISLETLLICLSSGAY
jgi:hypothetical protein